MARTTSTAPVAPAQEAKVETTKAGANANRVFNLLERFSSEKNSDMQRKDVLLTHGKQRLAEAADLLKEGTDRQAEANDIISEASRDFFTGVTEGLLSMGEVSDSLGNIFGFKKLKDGSPSRTPEKAGENIRKRIVRAVAAKQFLDGEADERQAQFFETLDKGEVETELNFYLNGGSIWTLYDNLATLKRENTSPVKFAFDPKKIAAFAASIMEDGAIDKIKENETLMVAYSELYHALNVGFTVEAEQPRNTTH